MQRMFIVVFLLGLVSLAAAYPSYVYVEEPEIANMQSEVDSLAETLLTLLHFELYTFYFSKAQSLQLYKLWALTP